MSRTLKLIVYAAVIEMALLALAIFAWRHGVFSGLPAPGPNTRAQPLVAFAPPWLALCAFVFGRRLASERPPISESHRRLLEGGLQVAAASLVAMQGFYAYVDVTGAAIDRPLLLRGFTAFVGLFLAFLGNGVAKVDPPGGDGAPAASVWTRTFLRYGWIVVVLGLFLAVCALAMPGPLLFPVLIVTMAIGMGVGFLCRHAIRASRPA